MKILKIVSIISVHKQNKSKGQVEAICLMADRSLETRHLYPEDVPKYTPLELIQTVQGEAK
jgi:hypothetical protein